MLESGLEVLVEPVPGCRSVSIGVWVPVGSRDEDDQLAGLTHFLEHLVFKGTERRSALQIAREIDSVGGDLNAFTTKETTCYYVRALAEHLPMAMDILADITCRPSFDPEQIELERSVVFEELRAARDDPVSVAQDFFYEAFFGAHPLGRPILGSFETVSKVDRPALLEHFLTRYGAGSMVLAVAGGVDPEEVCTLADQHFAGVRRCQAPVRRAPAVARKTAACLRRDSEEAHLFVAFPGLTKSDPRRYAAMFINEILGGSTSSRIFQEVREKRGLAYSAYSFLDQFEDSGCFGVYVGTAPEKVSEAYKVVCEELSRLETGDITAEEFEVAQGHIRGALALSDEDTGSKMSRLGRTRLALGRPLSLDEFLKEINSVSLEEVSELARTLVADQKPLVVLVGPFDAESAALALGIDDAELDFRDSKAP